MDNILSWAVQILVGVVVTFGGIILKNVKEQIKELDAKMGKQAERIDRHKDVLDKVQLPNVGVAMCERIQQGHNQTHLLIDKSIGYFDGQCRTLALETRDNREALIRFETKIDQILTEVKEFRTAGCKGDRG